MQKSTTAETVVLFGAGNRGRTCTVAHRNLNPACLPIPPYPHNGSYFSILRQKNQVQKKRSRKAPLFIPPSRRVTRITCISSRWVTAVRFCASIVPAGEACIPADRAGNPCKKLFGLLNHTVVEKGRTDVLFFILTAPARNILHHISFLP